MQELGITRDQASLAEEAQARQREFDEQLHALDARMQGLGEKVSPVRPSVSQMQRLWSPLLGLNPREDAHR